jgi:hypothetical protein
VVPVHRSWAALSAWRARRKRIRKAPVLAVFAAGIAAGAGLYIAVDGLYVKLTAPPPGAAAMAVIGNDLASSASIRPLIQTAVLEAQACGPGGLNTSEQYLHLAVLNDKDILQSLKTLSVSYLPNGLSDLPNGARLVSTLTTAMEDSYVANYDYYAWVTDLAQAGDKCGSNSSLNSNYFDATTASLNATTAKQAFVAIWNPMASRYKQPTYTYTDF